VVLLLRIRKAWGWRWRILLAIGISVAMFLAMVFFEAGQRGLPEMIGLSLAVGFVLVALLDVGNIQREVTVKDDCIRDALQILLHHATWFCILTGGGLSRQADWTDATCSEQYTGK